MLYTESDIENSMDKIETINFHQVLIELLIEIRSNKGWCNAFVIFNEFFKFFKGTWFRYIALY